MDKKVLQAYRLNSLEEPTDEMLQAIMEEVKEAAVESTRKAEEFKKQMLAKTIKQAKILHETYR